MRLIEIRGDGRAGAPGRALDRHALALHQAHLGEIAHVDDADRDLGRLPSGSRVEPGAGGAGVGAHRDQELPIGDQAKHAHVARQAIDGREDLEILGIGDGNRVERVHALGGNAVHDLASDVEGGAAHRFVLLAEVETVEPHRIRAVGDVPRFEGVQGGRGAAAARGRPCLAGEDAEEGAGPGRLVVDVGHLELVAHLTAGLEAGVAADGALGIADVDDREHRELVAFVASAARRGARAGVAVHVPVLGHHQRVRRRGDVHALEVLVVALVGAAELDAAAFEDFELADLLEILGIRDIERIHPRLFRGGGRGARGVPPGVVVALRHVRNHVDGVLDLARHALA